MKRTIALVAFMLILSGCQVVIIPVPVDYHQVAAAVTEVTTPLGTQAEHAEFTLRYDAIGEPWHELQVKLNSPDWEDAAWRAETGRLAAVWRQKLDDLSDLGKPSGALWVKAWPVLMDGIAEYRYAAGAIQNAAQANQPMLMESAIERVVNGVNLVGEAMRILGGE